MYTGQLDISEGSVPSLVATAQFLDMPLLEQLLSTHAITTTPNNQTPASNAKPKTINRTPNAKTNYGYITPRSRASVKQELLPAGPSRIDLEVCNQLASLFFFCLQ